MSNEDRFDTWAIVELLGHRRLVGKASEQEIAGTGFLRIDVPSEEGATRQTHLVNPSSVYCITPVSEEAAKLAARNANPDPVTRWELPASVQAALRASEREDDFEAREVDLDGPF